MVMGLSLLVYALAELRIELIRRDESIPNQVGKPTQRPTMRRIFQMFEGIHVLLIKDSLRTQRQVLNLKSSHHLNLTISIIVSLYSITDIYTIFFILI
jgi:transposase